MTITLDQLKIGRSAVITSVGGEGALRGFRPGQGDAGTHVQHVLHVCGPESGQAAHLHPGKYARARGAQGQREGQDAEPFDVFSFFIGLSSKD